MALLDQIAHRKAEIAELGRHRDHQPHMGSGNLVQSLLVAVFAPADRQVVLFLAFKIGRLHGSPDQVPLRLLFHRPRLPR